MSTLPTGAQFGRTAKLLVSGQNAATDLSQLRFRFNVYASDDNSPNNANIRVYNLKADTVQSIISEYDRVTLDAGYGNNFANIFNGTIKQFRVGKESNIDSFLEIIAADGDALYNFGTLELSLAENTTLDQRFTAYCNAVGASMDPASHAFLQATGGIQPKGKVSFGMFRSFMNEIANTAGCRWSIQNGKVTLVPLTGYLPGDPVLISSATGMVGVPDDTDNGINVTTLLNPLFQPGRRVQVESADISTLIIREQGFPNYSSADSFAAAVQPGMGIYRVLVVEHNGDTRDVPWYSELTCLSLDPTASNTGQSIKAYP